jgi:ABC-type proline/glycine betaine transport system permease subunit
MAMNFTRGLSIHFISSLILIWITSLMANQTFLNILKVSLAIGFVGFLFFPYTNDIWYESFDTLASLTDAIVAWGLVGVFLGWYLKKPNS